MSDEKRFAVKKNGSLPPIEKHDRAVKERQMSVEAFSRRAKLSSSQFHFLKYKVRENLTVKKTFSEWEKILKVHIN